MADPMQQIIVTTVGELHSLADTIATIDNRDVDSLARCRLIGRAQRQIKGILGEHAHHVFDQEQAGQQHFPFAGFRSAEGG